LLFSSPCSAVISVSDDTPGPPPASMPNPRQKNSPESRSSPGLSSSVMPFVPPIIPSTNHSRRFGWGPLIAFLAAIAVVVAILNIAGARFTWRGTPDGTILGTWDRTSSAWPEIREGQPTAVQSHDQIFSTPGGVLISIHFTTGDFDIAKKGHVHVPISAQAPIDSNFGLTFSISSLSLN